MSSFTIQRIGLVMNGWYKALLIYAIGFLLTAAWVVVMSWLYERKHGRCEIRDEGEDFFARIVIFAWPLLWLLEIVALMTWSMWAIDRSTPAAMTEPALKTGNTHQDTY